MDSALDGNKQVLIRTCVVRVVLSDFGSLDCIYFENIAQDLFHNFRQQA